MKATPRLLLEKAYLGPVYSEGYSEATPGECLWALCVVVGFSENISQNWKRCKKEQPNERTLGETSLYKGLIRYVWDFSVKKRQLCSGNRE